MDETQQNNTSQVFLCKRSDDTCLFLNEIEELKKEVSSLTELVRTDALTNLYNFRFFNETLVLEMERTRRGTQPLSMIMLDIDHFKKFNDKWGHEVGNNALVHIANLIKATVRKLDFPCRFGGEEFVILLPNTDLRKAASVAERLRELIASSPVIIDNQEPIEITASLGVDQFTSAHTENCDAFVKRVDEWLYLSKDQGRNQVSYPDLTAKKDYDSVTLAEKDALFGLLNSDE